MNIFEGLQLGFSVSFTPVALWYCFIGVLIGTAIGVLPGLGASVTIALLLPMTYGLDPTNAIILLAGIYYGAQYGASTTSILLNIPGEASSVVTCLDGHQMAKRGQAGRALGIAAFGSFIAGTVGTFGLAVAAPMLSRAALEIGPAEYFSLMLLGLMAAVGLASGTMLKSLIMVVLGLMLGTVGYDFVTGFPRFTFGRPELAEGFDLVPVLIGVFGLGEIFRTLQDKVYRRELSTDRVRGLLPTKNDWRVSIAPILRGTGVGFLLGIIPGGGAGVASYASYAMEKRLSKTPERFGTGAIEGVAGPESANNAGVQGAFIPLLTLGIPSNAAMALMVGALMLHGITPGPQIITNHPEMFWGVITSMYLGNAMLLALNLPLIGLWVRCLKVPYDIMFPIIIAVCLIGSYSIRNNVFDVVLVTVFGVIGYAAWKFRLEFAPFVLALLLGPIMENSLRQALLTTRGDFSIFMTRPVAAICLLVAVAIVLVQAIPAVRRTRQALPTDDD